MTGAVHVSVTAAAEALQTYGEDTSPLTATSSTSYVMFIFMYINKCFDKITPHEHTEGYVRQTRHMHVVER